MCRPSTAIQAGSQGYEAGTVERGLSGMMAAEPQPTAN